MSKPSSLMRFFQSEAAEKHDSENVTGDERNERNERSPSLADDNSLNSFLSSPDADELTRPFAELIAEARAEKLPLFKPPELLDGVPIWGLNGIVLANAAGVRSALEHRNREAAEKYCGVLVGHLSR